MATYELNLPVDDAQIEKLKVGDIIYLNGQVCTARDMAHLEMRALVEAGKPLPEDIRGGAIFHAGPVMKKDKGRSEQVPIFMTATGKSGPNT